MNKLICIAMLSLISVSASAEDLMPADLDRDPAAIGIAAKKRAYPGGGDEEDLRVLAALPEASMKTDSRSLQREVYKQLFNQDLKEDRQDEVEE